MLSSLYFLVPVIAFLYASVGFGGATRYLAMMSFSSIQPQVMAISAWGGLVIGRINVASSFDRTLLAVPAVVATVLVISNLVLIYLGTGVAILPLIAVLVFIVLDLWAPVWN